MARPHAHQKPKGGSTVGYTESDEGDAVGGVSLASSPGLPLLWEGE
jgi:hypothetical protein